MSSLEGMTAFVTGGGQGIGRGIALELARAGANIIIAQRHLDEAEEMVDEIRSLGKEALLLSLDVTNSDSVKTCVKEAIKHFSRIDILVNNAGAMQKIFGTDTTLEDFDLCYEVNLKGVWRVTSELIPHFKANNGGKIIIISSGTAREAAAESPAYSSSKGGVFSLSQSLASALGPYNINVNTICPGVVRTAMTENAVNSPGFLDAYMKENTALGRHLTPNDIGHAAVFLASSSAKNITGQALNVDGGQNMN